MPTETTKETYSVENILDKNIDDQNDNKEIYRILYGGKLEPLRGLETTGFGTSEIIHLSIGQNFELCGYYFDSTQDRKFNERRTCIAVIQNSIVNSATDEPVLNQILALHERIGIMLDAAGKAKVNIVCMQETWTMPYFFCNREHMPWLEFSESAREGLTTKFLSAYAEKYNMVIISPILERDESGIIWNTAVVIDNHGRYMGKTRKNHLSKVGDFDESRFCRESGLGYPVFDTDFGRVAINIGSGSHQPLEWLMYKLNGAQIVFNPSANVAGNQEHLWPIEARNAAIANSYFVAAVNRVGKETYPGYAETTSKEVGQFYGSSYITGPDGGRTPGLSRIYDGLLIADIDLNLCQQVSDSNGFQMSSSRMQMYAQNLTTFAISGHPQQIIRPATNGSCSQVQSTTYHTVRRSRMMGTVQTARKTTTGLPYSRPNTRKDDNFPKKF